MHKIKTWKSILGTLKMCETLYVHKLGEIRDKKLDTINTFPEQKKY